MGEMEAGSAPVPLVNHLLCAAWHVSFPAHVTLHCIICLFVCLSHHTASSSERELSDSSSPVARAQRRARRRAAAPKYVLDRI